MKMRAWPRGRAALAGVFVLTLLVGAIFNPPATASAQGTFSATGSMSTPRENPTMTLLQNGQVLVAGGSNSSGDLASAELYNPGTGKWVATGSMTAARYTHTATLLPNGLVLIAGGANSSGDLASAELYNPVTWTFTATGSMTTPRENHTATLLQNGLVLIAGGNNSSGPLASAELYNPATGTFTATGPMTTLRYVPTATLLQNGQVLVAGGINGGGTGNYLSSAELYNPAAGTFSATGSMHDARGYFTATLLGDGQVLIASGGTSAGSLTEAELYDPTAGTFSITGSMISVQGPPATLLNDGLVLVAGGYYGSYLATAEYYNPASGTFYTTAAMTTPRDGAAAALLQNGQVLVAGGADGSVVLASAELYTPPDGTTLAIIGNGTVEDNLGPVIDCTAANSSESGTCATTYSGGATVTLTASPAPGYTFAGWASTGSPACVPSGDICSFTLGSGVNVNSITAGFFGSPTKLGFSVPPSTATQGNAIAPAPVVQVEDASGNPVTSGPASTVPISIAIGTNPSGGTLFGVTTVNAVNGVATFSGLAIDNAGSGYTLTASSAGLTSATSGGFTVNGLYTDRVNAVAVGAQTGTLVSGTAGSVSYPVTVTYTIPQSHGGGKGTATLNVDTALPAGVTASFNPPSLYFCCTPGTSSQQSTLTISTSAGIPVATTEFIVSATSDYGGENIADGTMTVSENANVCPNGQITPAPCSDSVTVAFNPPQGTTLGPNSVQVVTQGAPNLDFSLTGTTCTGSPSSCSVSVKFAPQAPGLRLGAVNLTDINGNPVASTPISGIGNGPAIAYGPGIQTTVGSGLSYPYAVAVDSSGDVFIGDYNNDQVVEVKPGGAVSTVPAYGLGSESGIAVDGAGDVFIADPNYSQVVEVTPSGVETTVGSGLSNPSGVAVDAAGNIYIADFGLDQVVEVSPNGVQSVVPANGLGGPTGVAVDSAGNIYIADPNYSQVVELSASGNQTTVGSLNNPVSVAVDAAGDVFIADNGLDQVIEVTPSGVQTTVSASGLINPNGVAVDAAGDVFIADPNGVRVVEMIGSQAPSITFANTNVGSTSSDSPQSVTIQNIGNQPLDAVAPGLSVAAPNFVQVGGSGTPADCTGSFALTPGASCNLSLSFTPQAAGTIAGTAVFTDNALNAIPSASQTIGLSGAAQSITPTVTWPTSSAITYGQTLSSATLSGGSAISGNTSVPGSFTFTNPATVPTAGAQSESVTFSPADPAAYNSVISNINVQVNQATPAVTWPAASAITFGQTLASSTLSGGSAISPITNASVPGNFSFTTPPTTPAATGSQSVTFTPADLMDYNTVTGSVTVTVTSGPQASVSPAAIDFGTLYLGSVVTKMVTVANTGSAAMTITDPIIAIVQGGDSHEFVTVNLCPRSLAAGKSCIMTVTFIAGPHYNPQTAVLTVTDNASGSPQTVMLTATVIDPRASFNPSSLSFGHQAVNTSVTETVTLTNPGATALSITGLSVTGANAAQFSLTAGSTCGNSLAAGGSCVVSVTFKPVAKVSYSATLLVTDNAPSGSQTVPLSGTGH